MTKSWQYWIALVALVSYTGCSKPTPEPTPNPAPTSNSTTQNEPLITGSLVTTLTPASEVVTLFLESLKKGDAAQTRNLLTDAAKAEIDRRGLSIDPLGSAESSFRIGRTQFSDKAADAAYVEAEWVEPSENGESMNTDVVFTVHKENDYWRISGMAIDMGQDNPPVLVDFENMADAVPESPEGVSKKTVAAQPQQTAPQATTNSAAPAQNSGIALPPQVAQPVNTTPNSLR